MRIGSCAALASVVAMAGLVAACGGDDPFPGQGTSVVVSAAPVDDLVRAIGGDAVQVADIVPAGAEPHDVELTPDQAAAVDAADLAVVLGRDFQPAVERAAEDREGDTLVLLDAIGLSGSDPHAWLDPTSMLEMADEVERALARVDPEGAAGYAARADDYRAGLRALHDAYTAGLAGCERRAFLVTHAAFGHLAAAYDLEQLAIAGVSTEQEPSPAQVAAAADDARRLALTTVFAEPLGSRALAETVADEAGGLRVDTLDPVESLAEGASYRSVMRDNLTALQQALGCERAP